MFHHLSLLFMHHLGEYSRKEEDPPSKTRDCISNVANISSFACSCCAEQVDTNMAVRVKFETDIESSASPQEEETSFMYYFAEDELEKTKL